MRYDHDNDLKLAPEDAMGRLVEPRQWFVTLYGDNNGPRLPTVQVRAETMGEARDLAAAHQKVSGLYGHIIIPVRNKHKQLPLLNPSD